VKSTDESSRVCKNGTANFGQTSPTNQSGPPPGMAPNILVGLNQNKPFHLSFDWNYWNFWHNQGHPYTSLQKISLTVRGGLRKGNENGNSHSSRLVLLDKKKMLFHLFLG